MSDAYKQKEKLDYVYGKNGSFAERMIISNEWIVSGQEDVLEQADPDEYGFKIDLKRMNVSSIFELPNDTPIYSGVTAWEYQKSNLTDCFDTVGDLKALGESTLDSFLNSLKPKDLKHVSESTKYRKKEISEELAKLIFDTADWTSLSTKSDDILEDLSDCLEQGEYDAYPDILVA